MTRLIVLVLSTGGLFFAGCVGQGSISPGSTAYKWHGSARGTFVTEKCPPRKQCETVTLHNAPPGEQAYSAIYKVQHRALIGIPYGEEPITVYVIGDQAECYAQLKGLKWSADPNDTCTEPVWIR